MIHHYYVMFHLHYVMMELQNKVHLTRHALSMEMIKTSKVCCIARDRGFRRGYHLRVGQPTPFKWLS
jgi:hypothetical protein